MDGVAWRAAVHGVAKSRTWLSDFTSPSSHVVFFLALHPLFADTHQVNFQRKDIWDINFPALIWRSHLEILLFYPTFGSLIFKKCLLSYSVLFFLLFLLGCMLFFLIDLFVLFFFLCFLCLSLLNFKLLLSSNLQELLFTCSFVL